MVNGKLHTCTGLTLRKAHNNKSDYEIGNQTTNR